MGVFYYGAEASALHIDDRALAHLKVVIVSKLRRNESFAVSWSHPEEDGSGRSTLWMHPAIPIRFAFDEPEAPPLNREWLEELAVSANALGGIQLVEEHIAPGRNG
ncbi:hypothetical protein N8K70_09540 [Microbacterium betulae]|uniref:DUF7882 domain-containing protein n=1 Tax=Microbacterium betulae TaxID=2981139 RepID=A0AA97FDS5_9MICO|nr:hypothetical protein [Microbacterium sp. AB]WOF21636.1 hypothetical protein N8K70_09540 [Microbacterium sp. AB]